METNDVSVIIPTYNAAASIAQCLKSIIDQSYSPDEIIIVDNVSNDATTQIAKAYGAKILRQKSTAASARNSGVTIAKGKYVFFVDADQELSKGIIEECVTKCARENAGMARVGELFIGEGFWGSCSSEWKNRYGKVEQKFAGRWDILSGEPRFFAKKEIIRAGMFNANLVWGEDYDLYQRLKELNVKEISCTSKLYHYESASLKQIVAKNLRYGESMPTFVKYSKDRIFVRLARHSLLTWIDIASEIREEPTTFFGCTVLFCLKTYSMIAGLIAGLG